MEILKVNKKIKIHIKNNHGRSGTFPCDLEGEKNFTITKKHIQKALENEPKIRKQVEFFIDWDEDNFNSSMSSSEILLTYDFPTKNLKAIAPNLKWIHCTAAGVEHLSPFNWASNDLIITNSSGVHAKKAGEYVRHGKGPYILEMKTYRYRGHSMSDPAKYRTKEELESYKSQDPIQIAHDEIIKKKIATKKELEKINKEVINKIKKAADYALVSPFPKEEDLYTDVYI